MFRNRSGLGPPEAAQVYGERSLPQPHVWSVLFKETFPLSRCEKKSHVAKSGVFGDPKNRINRRRQVTS